MRTMITSISILVLVVFVTIHPAIAAEQFERIEMGESGQIVSFPLTVQETATENARKAQLKSMLNRKATRAEPKAVIFEMAESGQTIEFPEEQVEILIGGVAQRGVKTNEVLSMDPNS